MGLLQLFRLIKRPFLGRLLVLVLEREEEEEEEGGNWHKQVLRRRTMEMAQKGVTDGAPSSPTGEISEPILIGAQ